MTKELKRILETLPQSWDDVTYEDYHNIIKNTIHDDIDRLIQINNNAYIMAYFSKQSRKQVKAIPLEEFLYAEQKVNKVFTSELTKKLPRGYEIIGPRETSWEAFIPVMRINKDTVFNPDSVRVILNSFLLKDKKPLKYTTEEVEKLPIGFVYHAFFLLLTNVEKSLNLMQIQTAKKILKLKVKTKLQALNPFKRLIKKKQMKP